MVQTRSTLVVGAFTDHESALRAMEELRGAGYADDQLALVSRTHVPEAPSPEEVEQQKQSGHAAVGGAAAGAVLGAVTALGLSLIPGVGFLAAGGLLVNALGGAAFGAAAGTFLSPFLALELSEVEAHRYANDVEAGKTVVVVRAINPSDIADVKDLLIRHGAYDDRMNPN
jgi:hypothetical protein